MAGMFGGQTPSDKRLFSPLLFLFLVCMEDRGRVYAEKERDRGRKVEWK